MMGDSPAVGQLGVRSSPRNQRGGVIPQGPAWVGHTPSFGLQFLQLKVNHAT